MNTNTVFFIEGIRIELKKNIQDKHNKNSPSQGSFEIIEGRNRLIDIKIQGQIRNKQKKYFDKSTDKVWNF